MDKEKESYYQGMLNEYVTENNEEEAPQKEKQPTPKKKALQKYEQTGDALQETLQEETKELLRLRRGRPKMKTLQEQGVYIRTSFILRALYVEKMREIAFREGLSLKDVIEEAFKKAIEAYELKNGELSLSKVKKTAQGLFSEE